MRVDKEKKEGVKNVGVTERRNQNIGLEDTMKSESGEKKWEVKVRGGEEGREIKEVGVHKRQPNF